MTCCRVHTFRIDQTSVTFPWHKFKFSYQYRSWNFFFRNKYPSFIRLKCKIPWHVPEINAKFHFSLTQHRIPWQFPELVKISWHFLTCMNPTVYSKILPSQSSLGVSSKPCAQWHRYDPILFSHVPFRHRFGCSSHSSISENNYR